MALRASMNLGRRRGHFPRGCENLEPGQETPAYGHGGHELAHADLPAFPEGSGVYVMAPIGVRART
jgi:hypothetical protein